jgi:1-phosphatidylinositol-3-phosphate 5-kinase
MSSHNSPLASTTSFALPLGLRSRRGSLASVGSSQVDKEQLAQALDAIHNTASQSETLTTFNEFASPPVSSSGVESKGIAGEIMQNGLSGLYSRFRGAVGGALQSKDDNSYNSGNISASTKSSKPGTPSFKASTSSLTREISGASNSPVQLSSPSSRIQSPTASSFTGTSEGQSQSQKSSNAPSLSTPATSKSSSSSRPIPPLTKATVSSTVAPVHVSAFKDRNRVNDLSEASDAGTVVTSQIPLKNDPFGTRNNPSAPDTTDPPNFDYSEASDSDTAQGGDGVVAWNRSQPGRRGLTQEQLVFSDVDGTLENRAKLLPTLQTASSTMSSLAASETTSQTNAPGPLRHTTKELKRPSAIERITQSHLPGYHPSRASSTDRSTAEASPINTSAHNSVHHESFSIDASHARFPDRRHIPGTTTNEGDPEAVSARLEQMRKQVLSKEFWMADEICKECFLCGDAFTAFRRKHHCRTCGCIFDSKCTSIISGERFGVQGTLRVCKTCLDIINRRHDSSGSDESADDTVLPTSFFHPQQSKGNFLDPNQSDAMQGEGEESIDGTNGDSARPLATPMMAIPATRRMGESTNRRSAVLEIDVPQLSRPSSARSLKSLSTGRPPSSGHKRHQSKHNFLGRFRAAAEERAPFHRHAGDEVDKRSRLPTFHDDNIIDPDLAPYMSDEGSSGDEQMSIFAALNSSGLSSTSIERERSGFGSLLSTSKKHRSRTGEKSISGMSFASRGLEEGSASGSTVGHTRQNRRRNPSTASNTIYQGRGSPRQGKNGNMLKAFGNLSEELARPSEDASNSTADGQGLLKATRSASMRDARAPTIELNNASLHHVQRLLRQLLQDANIPNVGSWEKALIPILLQCTDDVNPDVRRGDDIDIRHYVKLKKVPGGKPGDTSYVSGVVFTKNLALKSMPRSISHPRIVIVSFPIEYQRRQQHFMSLEPVIAQEKEFLRNMVNRIASLRPHLLLVQSHISGLALQYLAEANIAVVYNVKQSVIEAVSRCAQTEIISSIDMVALKPVHVGKSASFDVKTYVHNDIPETKKTYIYISGCPKELGCTIVLRGADMPVLSRMKRITEFMVYVVYNLKLETCLMRDEYVLIPSIPDDGGSLSPSRQHASQAIVSGGSEPVPPRNAIDAASDKLQAVVEATIKLEQRHNSSEGAGQASKGTGAGEATEMDGVSSADTGKPTSVEVTSETNLKIVSAHESHVHGSHEDLVPEDIPMPTFYSDMVAKHQTKILSASPFVKFMQPYLLMRAREQERRLVYLKRLRDQDTYEEQTENEKAKPQRFQLIQPEMVHQTVKGAPKQIMEVLHAVHDAEYDKALHNYQTQKRQWENYIQGNLNLFDPYAHQNIVVLYTVVCTATTVPCAGPELLALAFYNEHESAHGFAHNFDSDCTLGQYVEDLCLGADTICTSNGCERKMSEHHRTYVHGEARITVFVEKSPCKIKGLQDSILMWSYCKLCKKETQVMPMSESTWKYSFGKYLELSFWSSDLRLRAGICPHDLHRDHLRYFGYRNVAIRIHYDPIDLLEIVVPRTRITWKVDNDLRLKNDQFTRTEERLNRFMLSVKSRIKGINIDSVVPEKVEACKAEVERMTKRAQEEHTALLRKLQEKYMESRYYEVIPLNRAIRAMQEKVAEWDATFADFDANYFPSEKDIRRLAALQLKRMFMDRDGSVSSLGTAENSEQVQDIDEKSSRGLIELTPHPSDLPANEAETVLHSVLEEENSSPEKALKEPQILSSHQNTTTASPMDLERDRIQSLDLAIPQQNKDGIYEMTESPDSLDVFQSSSKSLGDSLTSSEELSITPSNPSESTLSEKVRQIRKGSQAGHVDSGGEASDVSGIPKPSERGGSRRSGMAVSPPINRTQSQPTSTLHRMHSANIKTFIPRPDTKATGSDILEEPLDNLRPSFTEPIREKKLSDRLGLGSLKNHRKGGHSLIPRSVQSKRKESRVSTLAKHFEQLSREFEKERMRDRKQRAAKVTQSRAFPKASSKPIVEVYKDVDEAVEEPGPSDDDLHSMEPSQPNPENTSTAEGIASLITNTATGRDTSYLPSDHIPKAEETATEAETDDNQPNVSQTASDDDGIGSDAEHSLLDDIPDVSDIAESLGVTESSTELDLPKHEKSSLMKMLTNFWAERSASGWTQLEYPLNATDHVFVDSDVIVREDEPSSLIAFALSSEDYIAKLEMIRRQGRPSYNEGEAKQGEMSQDLCEVGIDQAEVETSLLRATGTHLKYQFAEGSAKMLCKIFYAEQFDAVRRKCGVADRIVESLSRCLKWDSKGGKTKSVFLKTLDDRLVLKSLSPVETQAFLRFAPAYFNIMAEALFHELPTVIAKMLGFYQIVIKNPNTGTEIKWDVLVMENLFYDRSNMRIFDLKGSMRNRKIQSTGEENEVLLDENMVEFIYESPLFAREHSKKLLRASVWNDTLFLARQNVMDYSLMVAVDEARKELVVGIIDCIRTYTWDKKLESWIKDRGFAGGGRNRPTVTSPKEYKTRFREAMARYVLQAPK